ncbi:MAG TPA: hypothetical protein VLD16_15990 [Gaiellaceae bacterium]|nr:hypothetical protein [Gaiellaceae bacterium]
MKRAILALALVAVAAAGCGGKQSYGSKVSKMCEDFGKREQKIGTPRSPAELATRGDRIVAAYDASILQPLLRTQAPPEDAAAAARLRQIARQQRDTLRALADAGKKGDVQTLRRLAVRNAQLNGQAGDIARQLGAKSCT